MSICLIALPGTGAQLVTFMCEAGRRPSRVGAAISKPGRPELSRHAKLQPAAEDGEPLAAAPRAHRRRSSPSRPFRLLGAVYRSAGTAPGTKRRCRRCGATMEPGKPPGRDLEGECRQRLESRTLDIVAGAERSLPGRAEDAQVCGSAPPLGRVLVGLAQARKGAPGQAVALHVLHAVLPSRALALRRASGGRVDREPCVRVKLFRGAERPNRACGPERSRLSDRRRRPRAGPRQDLERVAKVSRHPG